MNKLVLGLSICLSFVATTNAGEISVYEQAVINGSGVPVAEFISTHDLAKNDPTINRRDFGDCRDTWSCKKQDVIDYIKKNNGDVHIQPIKIPEPSTAALLSLAVLGFGFRSLAKTNAKHKC